MPPQPPPTHDTLSAAPVITHPRRRRRDFDRTRRRPQRSRQRQPVDSVDPLDPLSSLADISDTQIAFLSLKSSWPELARQILSNTPPLILTSQLRSLLSDSCAISSERRKLIRSGIARCVHLPTGEVALAPYDQIHPSIEGCSAFFDPKICSKWNIEGIVPEHVVQQLVGEDGIKRLIEAGWLLLRDESSFWTVAPMLGNFMRNREKGNNELLDVLKKEKYKEMGVEDLQERSLKNSCFTAQWHVRDLVGSGKVQSVHTTDGNIIRLTGRRS